MQFRKMHVSLEDQGPMALCTHEAGAERFLREALTNRCPRTEFHSCSATLRSPPLFPKTFHFPKVPGHVFCPIRQTQYFCSDPISVDLILSATKECGADPANLGRSLLFVRYGRFPAQDSGNASRESGRVYMYVYVYIYIYIYIEREREIHYVLSLIYIYRLAGCPQRPEFELLLLETETLES